jgi:hypothetical protein
MLSSLGNLKTFVEQMNRTGVMPNLSIAKHESIVDMIMEDDESMAEDNIEQDEEVKKQAAAFED